MKNNKNVALVLASGGSRGLAHIGAIEVLEEHGYSITSVAGASMGPSSAVYTLPAASAHLRNG